MPTIYMENTVNNPLVIRCKSCGGDQSFDIIKQQYVCAHCGSVTELNSQTAEFKSWKRLLQQKQQQSLIEAKMFKCPSCGAQTLASADDASAICPFCQSTMVDAKFANTPIPEVIIPFKVTKEDAEKRLQEWLSANKNNPAAQTIEKNMQRFSSCYLPYHIVRGAFSGIMDIANQAGESQEYFFKAYLNHTAVNASKDWDNLFLDGIEPFDFNDAREFDYRYLINQSAKIQNVETTELAQRIKEETSSELHETLSEKTILAALPVYLVQCENDIAAAVNVRMPCDRIPAFPADRQRGRHAQLISHQLDNLADDGTRVSIRHLCNELIEVDTGIVVGGIADGTDHRERCAELETDLSHGSAFHLDTEDVG